MTQEIFLNELKMELEKRKVPNIADILSDYHEHFEHGKSKGKSDREIIQALGSTSTLAQAHQAESLMVSLDQERRPNQMTVIWSALAKIIVLTPFNFLMLFIPGVIIFCLLVAGWSVALSLGSVGVAFFAAVPYLTDFSGIWHWLSLLFGFLGMTSIALFTGAIMFAITTFVGKAVIGYLRWNLKFVLEK